MKKLLWTSAMALTAAACMTACDDSSSGASNSIPEFKTEAALPDTCEMEVAKVDTAYFACFENKWIEITDSATVEQFKKGLDEEEIKKKLEELEELLKPATPAKPKSSSSINTESVDSNDPGSSPSEEEEEECTGRHCRNGDKSSSSKSSDGNGNGGGGSDEGGSGEHSGPSAAELEILGECGTSLKDTVKWTGEFTSAGSLTPDETKAGKYYACDGSKWAEVTKLHYAFGATCEAFKNTIQKIYDANFINNPDNWTDPFTGKAFNSDLNVLTDGNGTVLSSGGKMLGQLVPEWNGKTEIYTYNGVIYSSPLCKNDEYTVAPVGTSPMRRLCTKDNVGDRGRAFKQGSTVYGDNYWVCYEKGDGTYEWGQGFVDSRTKTGVVGDPLRFGTIYRMVTIGEQTWMAENLNYEYKVNGSTYGNICLDETDCASYGRYYTFSAAMDSVSTGCGNDGCDVTGNVQGICPDGWHIPSVDEWEDLRSIVGNETQTLISERFEGSDDYGFSVLYGGSCVYNQAQSKYTCSHQDEYGFFWVKDYLASAGDHGSWSQSVADAHYVFFNDGDLTTDDGISITDMLNIRCIKD